jgi:CubicO group peptidase (beta-lactamase class C family)
MRNFFLTLLSIIVCSIGFTQNSFYNLDTFLAHKSQQHKFSGIVLIAKEDTILFEKNYGLADYINEKPFTPTTAFQIASVSKQFTAFAIMLLQAKGKLNYDDFVVKYISEFPYNNITIRHLLWHTSGLPSFWSKIRPNMNHSISNGNKELVKYLIDNKMPLDSLPGLKYEYADIGYDLLAMIIENISGRSYQKYVEKNIFNPLKMNHTKALMVTDIRKIKYKKMAKGHSFLTDSAKYVYAHEEQKNDFVFYLGNFYGDGSIISTTSDLLKWNISLQKNKLLSKEQLQEAYLPSRYKNDSIINVNPQSKLKPTYGFGIGIAEHPVFGKFYYHSGGHPGFTSYLYRCPGNNISIIYLSNLNSSSGANATRSEMMEYIYKAFQ